MLESARPSEFLAKRARGNRLKRLRIQRMKPEIATVIVDTSSPETDKMLTGDIDNSSDMIRPCHMALPVEEEPKEDTRDVTSSFVTGGGHSGDEKMSKRLNYVSHGTMSVIGRRRAMEDAMTVEPEIAEGEFSFFAVYDGHGGSRVSDACRVRLHHLLGKEIESYRGGGGTDWEKVMMACFAEMDEEVKGLSDGEFGREESSLSSSVKTAGSTAVVVVVAKEEVVVANCGDSRAVLCRNVGAVPLSRDHKPDRPDEKERVETAGGRVINWNGCRVSGVLATSRSIGDQYLKPYVISEPEVTVNKRTRSDNFLIIASDGLWDVVSNDVACQVVKRCLDGQMRKRFSEGSAAKAASMLVELAMAKGSEDNISIIVVELKKSS
ncbi:hypothetical protein RJ639_007547 [Escallonia herrerae]|uniref:protein-serine/threonine phosphatase n=1 Tax=Escallonia herrerae TaxID=1293975 RepID=A0AA88VXA6_9ASTE|nr:hypothetical protein RJ639_007547 [Escallonia herrerae]